MPKKNSSFKKLRVRKPYQERLQPRARRHLGMLEKHKDYVVRAREYNAKKQKIKKLQEQASLRNPDEFHSGMIHAHLEQGKHTLDADVLEENFTDDELALMQSQDLAYIRTMMAREQAKIERLQATLHSLSATPRGTHTIFVDSEEKVASFDAAAHFDTTDDGAQRAFNRPRRGALAAGTFWVNGVRPSGGGTRAGPAAVASTSTPSSSSSAAAAAVAASADVRRLDAAAARLVKQQYAELDARRARLKSLDRMRRTMEMEAALAGAGGSGATLVRPAAETTDGVPVYRFAKERKR